MALFKSRFLCTAFFLFLANHSIVSAALRYPELNHNGLKLLQSGTAELLNLCSTSHCLYVFPGRSNVLISAYLEAKNLANTVSLPVSGIRDLAPENELTARARFDAEVVYPILFPKLAGVKNIIVVDMVNTGGGGSVTRTSLWIQNYVTKNKLPIQIQIAHYGASINNKYSQILEAAGIETDSIHLGSAPGTPGYLAKETLTENFAPYDEWNPLKAASRPAFHSHLRRAYPYYNSSNQKEFSHFASYDDLIELFKKVDPIAFIREQSPATYKFNCNQGLTSFRN